MTSGPLISIHIVDVVSGCPAHGVLVEVAKQSEAGGAIRVVANLLSDENGKLVVPPNKISDADLPCRVSLLVDIGSYYLERYDDVFAENLRAVFNVPASNFHYHFPLKITPAGVSLFVTRSPSK